ncbi:hypothetical protein HN51_029033 [Arachis hypogaea]|uniref:Sec-independent protein translocase protein TATB n=1 Tax=Arachis hypogaea TaxID=3818 RepID=A0A445BG73_ARAHY|nr:sec-independent protein translocase protein TATB, chloroplastic [Arachis hypogaea]RYR37649.1 hypothetical protein Ahy_A09g042507 [Arachis hypogaea]
MAMASPLSTSSVLCWKLKGTGSGAVAVCAKSNLVDLSRWCGLKHVGMSATPKPLVMRGKKGLWKGKVVYASLFGVGAPEALVIGVVALLVFGPKGLAEVARNLGKTLRAFQPTIRELQDVSREFKTTLEREIGLDDISTPPTKTTYNSTLDPNGTRDPSKPYSSEESKEAILPPPATATEPQPQKPETDNSPLDSSSQ